VVHCGSRRHPRRPGLSKRQPNCNDAWAPCAFGLCSWHMLRRARRHPGQRQCGLHSSFVATVARDLLRAFNRLPYGLHLFDVEVCSLTSRGRVATRIFAQVARTGGATTVDSRPPVISGRYEDSDATYVVNSLSGHRAAPRRGQPSARRHRAIGRAGRIAGVSKTSWRNSSATRPPGKGRASRPEAGLIQGRGNDASTKNVQGPRPGDVR
jgi:hypothetical protein